MITRQKWLEQRDQWFSEYPLQPIESKHLRLDLELSFPRQQMSEVPVDKSPHFNYDSRECFYVCADWSVIFNVEEIEDTQHERPTLRMLVESCHDNPMGDRIRLMSTACTIIHEHWAARQNWNDFAFFRGKFWRITWNEYFGDWPGGRIWGLPFQDRRHYGDNSVYEYLNDWWLRD